MKPSPDAPIQRPSEEASEEQWNHVFGTLVHDDQDNSEILPGLVAYALYKQSKREWAANLWHRKRKKPSPDELDAYVATWTVSRLEALRSEAEQILAVFASAYIDAARAQIREEAVRDQMQGLHTDLTRGFSRTQGWSAFGWTIIGGLISAFSYTILLIVIAYVIKKNGIDLVSLLR